MVDTDVVIDVDGWVSLADGEVIGQLHTGQHPGYSRWWRYRLADQWMANPRTWPTSGDALAALLRARAAKALEQG